MAKLVWQPTASLEMLKLRAKVLQHIRQFFAMRDVLEVETPTLAAAGATAPYIANMTACYQTSGASQGKTLYLQTSPEYAMKRLLAAGSGPIYQMCKAYRNGEAGHNHNPEFTMLEWYRPGFTHYDLMDEMAEFLTQVADLPAAQRFSYAAVFEKYLAINPHGATAAELKAIAVKAGISAIAGFDESDKDGWLDLLMSHVIDPQLDGTIPTFIYDFPASQAALARIRQDTLPVAERFEVYMQGIELANGFHELLDASEQQQRFNTDLEKRRRLGLPEIPIDHLLLAALQSGMPACSGVAVGIDRLMMVIVKAKHIADVLSFTVVNA